MAIKVDIVRQSFIVYCGIGLSACLTVFSGFMLLLHLPLMAQSYQVAIYLELYIYSTISSCMLCITFDCLISSVASLVLFIFFINLKIRKTFRKFLRQVYLCNCLFCFVNICCILLMIDSLGILHTDVQYRLHSKMKLYAVNGTQDLSKPNIDKAFIDKMQQETKCCGVTGPTDWYNIQWIPLTELSNLEDFKYLNHPGLVALAPMSCCDRSKTIICPLKDYNALNRYYTKGCRLQLSKSITDQLLSTEILLSCVLVAFQVFLILVFNLTSTSIESMMIGIHGENIGIASLTTMVPTADLELQSRGMPMLMQPTKENQPLQMKRRHFIEKTKNIGKVIKGTSHLRYVKETYTTTAVQKYLKIYFPIVERAIFDNDPSYIVILFRFFSKGFIGFQIANLFLTAFSTPIEGQTKISDTLVDLVVYSTYVSFTFAFVKSTKFRAVAILLIPNLGMKTGRAFLMAELARITALGPLASIAGNIQAVMLSLHCSMGVALNITKDIQKISVNPMRKLILKTIEESDSLKKATLDVYNASQPITDDIDDSGARAQRIRQAQQGGNTTQEVNVRKRFNKLLHRLDRNEQLKFQQKTQKLRDQYAHLESQLRKSMVQINRYKDIFSNKSSLVVSQMRTKMFSGCASVEQLKTQICQKVIGAACNKMELLIFGGIDFGFGLNKLCMNEIESDSSCNVKKALERSQKCANEQEAANVKDGFGGLHKGTKDGLSAMQEIFDFNITWKFDRKPFNIDGQTILHGTAILTFTLSDGVLVLVDLITLLFVVLKILLMLVIYRSYSYCKKYLTDLDYDNKYVTSYFEQIDQQRKFVNRSTLLPLKSYERKTTLYKQTFYTSDEISKVFKDLIKITVVVMSLGITFLIAEIFYTALEIIRDISLIELRVRTDELLNITATGDGFIKHLINILLDEIRSLGKFNVTYSLSDCAPELRIVSYYYRRLFIVTTSIIYTLTIFNGYLVRSRHTICAYFYPRRERQRIVHLYNKLLLGRKRYMRSKKNIIIFKVKQNRLETEYNFLLSLRRDYPYLFSWLKYFSKYRCLICDDKENKNFFICKNDFSAFCKDCYEEAAQNCLVCFLTELNMEEDNVNNYYESQYVVDSEQSDNSTSGNEISDIDNSKEVVGWLRHPVEILKEDVFVYKTIMSQLNNSN